MRTILPILSLITFFNLSSSFAQIETDEVEVTYLYTIDGPSRARRFDRNAALFLERTRRELYVLNGNHIYIYNSNGSMEFDFSILKHRTKHIPISIVVDNKGNIYVLHYRPESQFIEMYDFRGDYLGPFELKGYPKGESKRAFYKLDLDSKMRFYVTDSVGMDILIFDSSGKYLAQISDEQEEFSKRDRASRFDDIDFDRSGFTYLLDWGFDKVLIYDQSRRFVFSFGERGGVRGKFSQPVSLAVDRTGKKLIYIADITMHTVDIFTTAGRYVGEVGTFGSRPGHFYFPKQVVTDDQGQIYVFDLLHGIQVFNVQELKSAE